MKAIREIIRLLLVEIPLKTAAACGILFGGKPKNTADVILSLTSYGRRLSACAATAIWSVLRQNPAPRKIVLNLAHGTPLPFLIRRLRERFGMEINFCDDTRSYKKLIPTLERYPDAAIITSDDDCWYFGGFTKQLIDSYRENPAAIAAQTCLVMKRKVGGAPAPYGTWDNFENLPAGFNAPDADLFFVGCGGVLYPPHSLHEDVKCRRLFEEICPSVDDVWFNAMARRAGTRIRYVGGQKRGFIDIDAFYQRRHLGSALYHENCGDEKGNDRRIAALEKVYPGVFTRENEVNL